LIERRKLLKNIHHCFTYSWVTASFLGPCGGSRWSIEGERKREREIPFARYRFSRLVVVVLARSMEGEA